MYVYVVLTKTDAKLSPALTLEDDVETSTQYHEDLQFEQIGEM